MADDGEGRTGGAPAGVDLGKPSIARIYDYFLGGKDNYDVDRNAAEVLLESLPTAREELAANRAFLGRAVRMLSGEYGIWQFLDLGTGLPTQQNVHQVAQQADPTARVVYVDNDPIVLAHARALLDETDDTTVVHADLCRPDEILTHPQVTGMLDFDAPIGVLAVAILHFIGDADDPWSVLARIRDALPSGSALVLTHGADDPRTQRAAQVYGRTASGAATGRTREAVAAMFDGFDLVEPGLVPVSQWRPARRQRPPASEPVVLYAGVGRKP